jgi:hypothetical protein
MSKFEEQTGRSIEAAFAEFHSANPLVYDLFKGQVFRAIQRNRTKISSKQIIGYLRWEVALQINNDKDEFKINDAFTSHYARLFAKEHPQHADIFNFRELRSGTDTHEKKLLTDDQVKSLELISLGKIIKIGRNINIVWDGLNRSLEFRSFNRFLKLKYITATHPATQVQGYVITDIGSQALKSFQK